MNASHRDQWDSYSDAWKAGTETEKRALFDQTLAPGCVYRDPLTVTEGWDALVSYMLEFHKMIPGGHFVTREFKAHNNRCIVEWDMCTGDGATIGAGISYGEFNDAGLLVTMTGFFDPPEAN